MKKTTRILALTGVFAFGLAQPAHAQEPVSYAYTLEGSSHVLRTEASTPLKGDVAVKLDPATGGLTADLTLARSSLRFALMGGIPVRADIVFAPTGPVTGTFKDGVLTTESRMLVKLPVVRILGLPIAGGDKCETVYPTYVKLTSDGPFDLATGGTLKGTYTLPKFEGCGRYEDLVSGMASGPGNTVDLKLTSSQS
ncbi:MAG TPA: hypothetical protein VHJ17_25305 [Thermomonospora sp.]|nr:hypothetical protein [Thermomonospora sp.]